MLLDVERFRSPARLQTSDFGLTNCNWNDKSSENLVDRKRKNFSANFGFSISRKQQ